MSQENPLWGVSGIHGELSMRGFEGAQSAVSKYMRCDRRPPSQSWKTFLRNHADAIASIDLCIVPTMIIERLFAFSVVGHDRRPLLRLELARHPTAERLTGQITEAFPWATAPSYPIRDNEGAYGNALRAMGIRDRPISRGSPWQNGIAERSIGTLRRECLDHTVVFGERHFMLRAICLCCLLQANAPASIAPEGGVIAASDPAGW